MRDKNLKIQNLRDISSILPELSVFLSQILVHINTPNTTGSTQNGVIYDTALNPLRPSLLDRCWSGEIIIIISVVDLIVRSIFFVCNWFLAFHSWRLLDFVLPLISQFMLISDPSDFIPFFSFPTLYSIRLAFVFFLLLESAISCIVNFLVGVLLFFR